MKNASYLLLILPKITEKHKDSFDRNIIRIITSFIPPKIDVSIIKTQIKSICHTICEKDIDWLVRFYKYYSEKFSDIDHNRLDIRKGSFNDNFDSLFENSLYNLRDKTRTKTKISVSDIESEFHPFIFFNTKDVDFGRGPRLRKTSII